MKIITFDCYGTLLNTEPLYHFIEELGEMNHLAPDKARRVFESYEDRLMYGEAFIPYDQPLHEVLSYCDMELGSDCFVKHFIEVVQTHQQFTPFPDVKEALCHLKAEGYELAVMSNSTKEMMGWHLRELDSLIDDVLLADDTKCYKPNLSFFQQAEQRFSLLQKEHCHVAKGYWWDIVPATKMGWKKIWVNRMGFPKGRDAEQPYHTVSSLEELKNVL